MAMNNGGLLNGRGKPMPQEENMPHWYFFHHLTNTAEKT
jgi:hypothetical protein